jgi:nucleotide-binding universal stress UspA family protein
LIEINAGGLGQGRKASMKSLLVPVSGGDGDETVLAMTHAVASLFAAHLDFVHIRRDAAEVKSQSEIEARAARQHVKAFCHRHCIEQAVSPQAPGRMTANWQTIQHDGPRRLTALARTHDLVIMERPPRGHGRDTIETVVAECGRPVLLVPSNGAQTPIERIAVWWKDHAAASRAVTASMPLLEKAVEVSILIATEDASHRHDASAEIARGLGWHGIKAHARHIREDGSTAIDRLWNATVEERAGLVVMGAFSHSRTRELIFGGCTRAALDRGTLPVLLLH